jgi:hypothetical protein
MSIYIVTKPFTVDGEVQARGLVLDAATTSLTPTRCRQLSEQRYLRIAEPDEIPSDQFAAAQARPSARKRKRKQKTARSRAATGATAH